MKLASPEFSDQGRIPQRFTCEGQDLSPPFAWSEVPEGSATLALTCVDPDAPRGTFVHWVLWGLDPSTGSLSAGEVAAGAGQGRNDFGRRGYGGPCPPPGHGTHHYQFTLYALRSPLTLADGATIAELRQAMEGNVLAEAVLVGTYER
ncbi:MAG: YbhB/YbcL family Raf kinase inhibitor-like protein [Egibacteraceae bacterium]